MTRKTLALSASAFAFVLTMGVVNLFADMTYEGGAAINGPFLASLGASAAAVSIIAGVGEFLGYSLLSRAALIAFAVIVQLVSIPLFVLGRRAT